jgi:hypothetical protein
VHDSFALAEIITLGGHADTTVQGAPEEWVNGEYGMDRNCELGLARRGQGFSRGTDDKSQNEYNESG